MLRGRSLCAIAVIPVLALEQLVNMLATPKAKDGNRQRVVALVKLPFGKMHYLLFDLTYQAALFMSELYDPRGVAKVLAKVGLLGIELHALGASFKTILVAYAFVISLIKMFF